MAALRKPPTPAKTVRRADGAVPSKVHAFTQQLFEAKGGPGDALARVHAAYIDNQKLRPKAGD